MSIQTEVGWRAVFVIGLFATLAALAPLAALAQETAPSGAESAVGGVSTTAPGGLPATGGGPVGRPITLPNTGQGPGEPLGMPAFVLAAAGLAIASGGAYVRRGRTTT
jgi:hypothetical protein